MSDTYEGRWEHICGESGIEVYYPRDSVKFCPYCGLSQGAPDEHPVIHWERIEGFKVDNKLWAKGSVEAILESGYESAPDWAGKLPEGVEEFIESTGGWPERDTKDAPEDRIAKLFADFTEKLPGLLADANDEIQRRNKKKSDTAITRALAEFWSPSATPHYSYSDFDGEQQFEKKNWGENSYTAEKRGFWGKLFRR